MRQCLPTVLIPFKAERAAAVESALDVLDKTAIQTALDKLGIVHFMGISVLINPVDDGPGALLVLDAAADGDTPDVLCTIALELQEDLEALLRVADVAEQAPDLPNFLIAHEAGLGSSWLSRTLGLPFAGTPGLTVRRILREAQLVQDIGQMTDLLESDESAFGKLEQVRTALWGRGDVKWAFVAEVAPHFDWQAPGKTGAFIRTFFPAVATLLWPAAPLLLLIWWSPWFLLLLPVFAWRFLAELRRLERDNVPDRAPANADYVKQVMERENLTPQNMLITVSEMQPGWFRRFTLRIAFVIIGQIAAREFRPGFLADLGTIHFARWLLLPGGKKVVLLSHYDGSLESYLEDFVQETHEGMTAIWSNAQGFPRSRWLFLDGAHDGDRLRRYVLRQLVPVRFRYSAYPSLSTARIRANAAICRGIAAATTSDEAEAWLAAFGASGRLLPSNRAARNRAVIPTVLTAALSKLQPVPLQPLETDSIPTLLFGSRKHLPYAATLFVRLDGGPECSRRWLSRVAEDVTYGRDRQQIRALALGLAATAFDPNRLDLATDDRATFAPAFLNGMSSIARARALGDVDDNAPATWIWGGPKRVDVVLMLYDESAEGLDERVTAMTAEIGANGHALVSAVTLVPVHGRNMPEPFGFSDGISQPKIRGIDDDDVPLGNALLEPGEFILGYRDGRGYLPISPSTATSRAGGLKRRDDGRGDLGRNGTYLVVRQLDQDVQAFDTCRRQMAADVQAGSSSLATTPTSLAADLIGAKLVGRWQNGSPLAQHTASPGQESRNDYLFGNIDAAGNGCPLGAHIRRANPRDSLAPGSDRQLALTNRHRILRVGRQYAAAQPGDKPGLMFICFNVDIGRQFEFIQQTWLLGRSFHGLGGEVDPLLRGGGRDSGNFTVHTPQGPLRLSMDKPFVTVRGGEYFFMPGREALEALGAP